MESVVNGSTGKGLLLVTLDQAPALVDDGVRRKALAFNGVNQYAEINSDGFVLKRL